MAAHQQAAAHPGERWCTSAGSRGGAATGTTRVSKWPHRLSTCARGQWLGSASEIHVRANTQSQQTVTQSCLAAAKRGRLASQRQEQRCTGRLDDTPSKRGVVARFHWQRCQLDPPAGAAAFRSLQSMRRRIRLWRAAVFRVQASGSDPSWQEGQPSLISSSSLTTHRMR